MTTFVEITRFSRIYHNVKYYACAAARRGDFYSPPGISAKAFLDRLLVLGVQNRSFARGLQAGIYGIPDSKMKNRLPLTGGQSRLVGGNLNVHQTRIADKQSRPARVLEIGNSDAQDRCVYSDIDMVAGPGNQRYRHRDGTPYPPKPG